MNRNILLATTVVAGLAGFASMASAQITYDATTNPNGAQGTPKIYGGGSSLAVNMYNRTASFIATATNVGTATLNQGLNTPGAIAGSTQGELWYQADGSGAGQKAFLTQTPTVHTQETDAGAVVAFGATDAYLSTSQIACWNTGSATDCSAAGYSTPTASAKSKGGPLIQLPAFGTAIAIAHTNFAFTKGIQLDDNDICGIFSGKITDWSGIETKPGGTAPKGLGGAIKVYYRQDGSGTSFLFTQHLAAVCNSTNSASGVTFTATKLFADVFGATSSGGTWTAGAFTTNTSGHHFIGAGHTPAGSTFVAASGSGGVADGLIGGTNNVAYLTPDYTSIAPKGLVHYAAVAALAHTTINTATIDPSLSVYQNIKVAKVYNSTEGKAYLPNAGGAYVGLINPAPTDFNPGYPASLAAAQNPTQWVPAIATPLKGYPIVGYTTLELPTCYYDAGTANYMKAFLTQLYSAGNKPNLVAEGFTGVPSAFSTIIKNVFITGKAIYQLNIQNPTVCNQTTLAGTFKGLGAP